VSIFGTSPRTDPSPSKYTETTYTFLRRAAGPVWDQVRALIDDWMLNYPARDRASIEGRLRSGNDEHFISAFWELYLHEMYRRAGWAIEVEPDVPDARTGPDFLVSQDGMAYYVEARCTFERQASSGAGARLQTIYDAVNEIDSGAFFLSVTAVRIGTQSPSTRQLRVDLECWLRGLDPDEITLSLSDNDPNRFDWQADDWQLVFHPVARSPATRGEPAGRPLGVFLPSEASFIDDVGSLRAALED